MSLDFLKPLFARYRAEQAKPLAARERAIELVRKGVRDGALNEKETAELYKAMQQSGTPVEHLEADASFLEEFIALESAAADLEKRRARAREAGEAVAAFRAERTRTIERLNAEDDRTSRAEMVAGQELEEANAAVKRVREMKKTRPELVGAVERAPAVLLLSDTADRFARTEFPTSMSPAAVESFWREKLWPFAHVDDGKIPDGFDFNSAHAERLRLESLYEAAKKAAEKQDHAIAASGLKTTRIDPSRPADIHIDPSDYDFRAAPGQSPAEFNKLLAAINTRAKEDADYRRRLQARMAVNAEHNELAQKHAAAVAGV